MTSYGLNNIRQLVFITVAVFGATLLFFALQKKPHSPFHPSRQGPPSRSDDELLGHVLNQTLGFQKIFVISLPSRTDHRDALSLSAALTGLQVEYVDGVTDVSNKALPPGGRESGLDSGPLNNWRAHMNVARMIVEQNITSALVLEDDADWDIRIKSQLQDFARASRLLVQPLPGQPEQFLDPSYPEPTHDQKAEDFEITKYSTTLPSTSPYGDISRWDLLWLGHCGTHFPSADEPNVPIGRAVIYDDETVPEPQHIAMQFGDSQLVQDYPPHTRVVTRAWANVCTLGYGISQPGARRLLYGIGVNKLNAATDLMLRSWCDGLEGRPARSCLTVQPQIFQHHRPVGSKAGFSDISNDGGREEEYNERAFTRNVRWSTRMNLEKLVDGWTNYVDLFEDGEDADPSLGFF